MRTSPSTKSMDMSEPTELSNLEKAKQIADRINRNRGALISMRTSLEVKSNALVYAKKRLKDATEDVDRLTPEIPALEKHIVKLEAWCCKHMDSDEQVQLATLLAKKIQRLQKELEVKRNELARLENGLSDTR